MSIYHPHPIYKLGSAWKEKTPGMWLSRFYFFLITSSEARYYRDYITASCVFMSLIKLLNLLNCYCKSRDKEIDKKNRAYIIRVPSIVLDKAAGQPSSLFLNIIISEISLFLLLLGGGGFSYLNSGCINSSALIACVHTCNGRNEIIISYFLWMGNIVI